ncbi:MAG: hypothetical protein FWF96_01410 [Kiritimatiellaeota bacterium]|nr:hypothetical protein [Kiritimatiellota bacterium]
MKNAWIWGLAATLAVAVAIAVWWRLPREKSVPVEIDDSLLRVTDTPRTADFQPGENAKTGVVASGGHLPQARVKNVAIGADAEDDDESADDNGEDDDEDLTPAERAVKEWEDLAEKLQEADFTADPRLSKKIKEAFDALEPGEEREHHMRAMVNLISDGAIHALVPILLDTGYDEDILDIIFDDILNRDDEIKYPILEEIVKNPDHPNFVDAAHILEVTQPDEGAVVIEIEDEEL